MSLFGAIVRTVVNVATLPVSVAKDVITLGGISTDEGKSATSKNLQRIKDESETAY